MGSWQRKKCEWITIHDMELRLLGAVLLAFLAINDWTFMLIYSHDHASLLINAFALLFFFLFPTHIIFNMLN